MGMPQFFVNYEMAVALSSGKENSVYHSKLPGNTCMHTHSATLSIMHCIILHSMI